MQTLIQALMDYGVNHLGLSKHHWPTTELLLKEKLSFVPSLFQPISKDVNSLEQLKNLFLETTQSMKLDAISLENLWIDCMGIITPSSEDFQTQFWKTYAHQPLQTTQRWHQMQVANDYIKASLTSQNITFRRPTGVHEIECTINLAKPEKRNEDIAKLVQQPVEKTTFPLCAICRENLGFSGSMTQASKMNMRIVDVKLGHYDWFIQYSPYAYFPYHLIAVDRQHRPMEISPYSIRRLFDFLTIFPHFFIGSNSDLPIVGGSILNHEHFQGGTYNMPLFTAKTESSLPSRWPEVTLEKVQWFNTVIKLKSMKREAIEAALNHLASTWRSYSDPSVEILAKTTQQHNSLTLITRKEQDYFEVFVVLRNNRTNEQYPQGIFHAHPEYHGIKKEGIGLIESLGLMVLPARLKREFETLKQAVNDHTPCPSDMLYHQPLYDQLVATPLENQEETMKRYACEVSANILENTAVFKKDSQGQKAWQRFIQFWLS